MHQFLHTQQSHGEGLLLSGHVQGWEHTRCCRQDNDNNPPHESFVESSSRARMSYHSHPKSHLYSIM